LNPAEAPQTIGFLPAQRLHWSRARLPHADHRPPMIPSAYPPESCATPSWPAVAAAAACRIGSGPPRASLRRPADRCDPPPAAVSAHADIFVTNKRADGATGAPDRPVRRARDAVFDGSRRCAAAADVTASHALTTVPRRIGGACACASTRTSRRRMA
jgi:hypothetical protein